MQTLTKAFDFKGNKIRIVPDKDGEPLFVAMDVADILGYSDAEAMTRKLDDDEVQNLQIVGFGNRGVNVINESGLYTAIIGSQKPEAKAFKKWVTSEVLPTIRKTGVYADLDGKLTSLSKAEVALNVLRLANELRAALPGISINDDAVMIDPDTGKHNFSGDTRERTMYYREMDERGLPGIAVVCGAKVEVHFDWFASHKHDAAVVSDTLDALANEFSNYKNACNRKAFAGKGSFEAVKVGTKAEADTVSKRMREIIESKLARL